MDMSELRNYPSQKLRKILGMLKLDIMFTMSSGKLRLILVGRNRDKNNELVQSLHSSNFCENELKAFRSVTNWVQNWQRWSNNEKFLNLNGEEVVIPEFETLDELEIKLKVMGK